MTAGLDVATTIAAAVGSLTLGTNIFNGPVRPASNDGIPHEAVFCFTTSGLTDEPFIDGGAGGGTVPPRPALDDEKLFLALQLAKELGAFPAPPARLGRNPAAPKLRLRRRGHVRRHLRH